MMPEEEIVNRLKAGIGEENVLESSVPRARRVFAKINVKKLKEAIQFLKSEGYAHLSAITGLEVDNGIELLYHLNKEGIELTLRVELPLNEAVAPTITDIIPGAVLYEREVHDLLGVKFEGHPNLTRLILPDEWPENSHPLRKRKTSKETSSE
ncbi:MAG: NADH-quinone oxidoreductase subunit C [Candidatus Bathyarchaeia archaeon]